ncbi:MAG: ATP phosphoribosyltransferase regulatory subunit [Acidiferrobacteraceae bacterium]|jgi:ATP phosphoribosyltransferase regulatory subunit
MSVEERWLLPDGIEEVLPQEARRLERFRRRVLDLLERWGYALVMPPLIEYLDSLLTGVAQELDLQTFKITDQLSGRLMGIRADMTPQAARIDSHYLKHSGPVRLCYAGPVLRTRPDEAGGSREPVQLGAELFGHSGPASDAEIICLMIATLEVVGIDSLHVDLGHVGIFRELAKAAGLDADQEATLFDAMQRKAESEIHERLGAWGVDRTLQELLTALPGLNGDAAVLVEAREKFSKAPANVLGALDDLEQVSERVRRDLPDRKLFYDLAELSGYGYHTGVVFSAFIPGHGNAIANGGRYDGIGAVFGRPRPATGFGVDLRLLARLSEGEAGTEPGGILAPDLDDADLRVEIARLREQGERVVQALPDQDVSPEELQCDRELAKSGGKWKVRPIS